LIDFVFGVIGGFGCQVSVFAGCQDAAMAQVLLNFK
jgi:hypothetical protein